MDAQNLAALASWSAVDICGRLDEPGVGIDHPSTIDFSACTTTPDQLRIELFLDGLDLAGRRLLHVGVGNSSLAVRFHARCLAIDGVTLAEAELSRAQALRLDRYRVWRANKYGSDFSRLLEPGYDYIIDNNPASFACCRFHFARMLDHYRWALRGGGRILTDRQGLDWVAEDPRWAMTFADLAESGDRFGLRALRLTESIYALERT
jgi:hypothetical protein